jgi:hypothetical protein
MKNVNFFKTMTFVMMFVALFFLYAILFGMIFEVIISMTVGFTASATLTVWWAYEWDKEAFRLSKIKKIFIICPVRNATDFQMNEIRKHIEYLECNNHNVYYPAVDTQQNQDGLLICMDNHDAIKNADEVHIYYDAESRGSHFDLGVAFSMDKKLVVINKARKNSTKSFYNMITDWENATMHMEKKK